eukprot:UN24135
MIQNEDFSKGSSKLDFSTESSYNHLDLPVVKLAKNCNYLDLLLPVAKSQKAA